jgi:hypothetical protein
VFPRRAFRFKGVYDGDPRRRLSALARECQWSVNLRAAHMPMYPVNDGRNTSTAAYR